jgi:SAM-dependent methyltransferase
MDRLRHALTRHRRRHDIEILFDEMSAKFDKHAFAQRMRPFWDPLPGAEAAKYLVLETWLREAIFRYLISFEGIDSPGRVVDLGSGTGYFLWVCREHGHEVLGIDLFNEPLYAACFEFFALPRIECRIEPQQKLHDFGGQVRVVTAFMACFDSLPDGRPWDVPAWQFFLDDMRERLVEGGRVVVKFNADAESGDLYSRAVSRCFGSHHGFRSRALMDYVFFDAI